VQYQGASVFRTGGEPPPHGDFYGCEFNGWPGQTEASASRSCCSVGAPSRPVWVTYTRQDDPPEVWGLPDRGDKVPGGQYHVSISSLYGSARSGGFTLDLSDRG
jgi:hypothetical protein